MDAIPDAVARLTAAGARTELRIEVRAGRRLGPIRRPDVVVPLGRVWRLGAVLLGADGTLYRTGEVIQAQRLRHPNHQSALADSRRVLREAIAKAGIDPGETVVLDGGPLPADAAEISWDGSGLAGTMVPLAAYLRERVELLADPPAGAGESGS